MDDLYCKLYVGAPMPRGELIEWISRTVGGVVRTRTIANPTMELDVGANDEEDAQRKDTSDGFLFFPFIVDVTPTEGSGRTEYVTSIASLARAMRDAGMRVVAACDFEEELGRTGAALTSPLK